MRSKSIWNDTFKVEYSYSDTTGLNEPRKSYTELFKGSLKTLNRRIIDERRHGHASVNFYDSNDNWLKNIMY